MKFFARTKARWLAAPEWQRLGVCAVIGFVIGLAVAP